MKLQQKEDPLLTAQKALFEKDGESIRRSRDGYNGPATVHAETRRGTATLSSKQCMSIPLANQVAPAARINMALREQRVRQLDNEIAALTDELLAEAQHRHELAQLFMVLNVHMIGASVAEVGKCSSRTQVRHAIQSGKDLIATVVPEEQYRFEDYSKPTTTLAGLMDAMLKSSRYGSGNYRFAPATLSLAVAMQAKSPSAYRILQSSMQCLPASRTVASYCNLGNMSDGTNIQLLTGLNQLCQLELKSRGRANESGLPTEQDVAEVCNGQIQMDAMAVCSVRK